MLYPKLLVRYYKLKVEYEILLEENVELKETLKDLMYKEVVINPSQNKKLKEQLQRSRSTIKNLRNKLKGGK